MFWRADRAASCGGCFVQLGARRQGGARLSLQRASGHGQDFHSPHPRQGHQLRKSLRRRAVRGMRIVLGVRGWHFLRPSRAGRRLQQQGGRHPRFDFQGVFRHARPPQGVCAGRSAHAHHRGRERSAENLRRAAGACLLRDVHDRAAQGGCHCAQPSAASAF